MLLILLVAATLMGSTGAGRHDIYSGCSLVGVVLRDLHALHRLHALEAALGVDVWQHGAPGQQDAHVMVCAHNAGDFLRALDDTSDTHYLILDDVTRALEEVDEELVRYRNMRAGREAVPFDDYPRYAQVDAYLEGIAAQYPSLVTIVNAGLSFENRPIKYLRISTTNFADTSKPVFIMDAMIHAREWVTTPVTLYAIHRLVESLRAEDRDLLEDTDWIVLPVVNPDGYEYTHTDERLWRRTRSAAPDVNTTCLGVDANRNFDVSFNTVGVSADPCSNTYPGTAPFSEPETRLVRDLLAEHLTRTQMYLNIHSYGNWILFGYGNTSLPVNGAHLHHVGAAMGAAIDAVKLPQAPYYAVGNSAHLLYATSGSAQDYAQAVGVPFSYTLELPAYGYDFRVPPEYIAQINEETWRGIAAAARLARLYYRARQTLY